METRGELLGGGRRGAMASARAVVATMRPRQWVKNLTAWAATVVAIIYGANG